MLPCQLYIYYSHILVLCLLRHLLTEPVWYILSNHLMERASFACVFFPAFAALSKEFLRADMKPWLQRRESLTVLVLCRCRKFTRCKMQFYFKRVGSKSLVRAPGRLVPVKIFGPAALHAGSSAGISHHPALGGKTHGLVG